jgi:hypothetical protein
MSQLSPRFAIHAIKYPHALNRHHTTCRMLGSQTPAAMIQRAKMSHFVISSIISP